MRTSLTLLTFILLIATSTSVFAQNTNYDNRLLSKFSKKELKNMEPERLSYWTFFLENSIEIVDIPKEKPDAVPAVVSLKSLDPKEVNVFELGFTPHEFARDYVRINGTTKMIIILPQSEIDERFNKFNQ